MLLFTIAVMFTGTMFGQLTGIKNIPGDYATITAAVAALNTQGVGAGGVTFKVAAGYTETLTSRIDLTATGTSSNPIVFQKNGAGPNPLLTAYAGINVAGTAAPDGMWSLTGSDYVTINGIDLFDPVTNLSPNAQMEYGYGLFKTNGTDGANYNTIQNCTITLNRNNNSTAAGPFFQGSIGIALMDCAPATATVNTLVTAASGASSNNKFYSNTIQNVNCCIALSGYPGAAPFTFCDNNNDIGGSSLSTGNTLINFGGGTGAANAASGVFIKDQWGFNVSYNVVNNNNGSGVNHPLLNRGIWANASSLGASGTINNNTVTIKGGGSTTQISAIENSAGSSGIGNAISINNNNITNCTNTLNTTGAWYGIYNNASSVSNLNIQGNIFTGNSDNITTATMYMIYNSGACPGTININGNQLSEAFPGATAFSGTLYGIYNSSGTVATNLNINSNDFNNFTFTTPSTATLYFINNTNGCANLTINSNTFTNLNLNSTGTQYLINNGSSTQLALVVNNNSIVTGLTRTGAAGTLGCYYAGSSSLGTSTQLFSGNNFSNITAATSGTGTFYGIYTSDGSAPPYPRKTYSGNTLSNISYNATGTVYMLYGGYDGDGFTGTGSAFTGNTITNLTCAGSTVYGLYVSSTASPLFPQSVSGNTVCNLTSSSASAAVYGVYLGATTAGLNFYRNNVYGIASTGATASVYGVYVASASTYNIYNNFISDIRDALSAPAAATSPALTGLYISSGTTVNAYYNTIYMNAAGTGANFSTAGVYVSTTPILDLRNNIVDNTSTPGSAGRTVACWRSSATLTTYSGFSNNNDFYAGLPGASNLLLYDGTTGFQTLATYKAQVAPRDYNAVTENPPFINVSTTPYNMHLQAAVTTQCESGGTIITSPFAITTDYDNDNRYPTAGYPGTANAPDIGADEFAGLPSDITAPTITYNLLGNQCGAGSQVLTATITDASGVPTSGIGLPVLYYKVNAGAWVSQQGVSTGTNQYTFTINPALVAGDVVSYYVTAQDLAATPNVGVNPSVGAATFTSSPPAAATAPTTPNSYTMLSPLSGIKTIPGDYATIAAAITALNSGCLGAGGVTFNVTAGYTETFTSPTAGLITASYGSSGSPIIFQKSGAGANPLITAGIGTTTTNDGIIVIAGTDYITFDGIDVQESAANITATTQMEWGYALVKKSNTAPFDGCQNVTIKNCAITLKKTNTATVGIYSGTHISTSTTGLTITAATDAMNNCKFFNNTISNVYSGISLNGFNASAPYSLYDQNNEVGNGGANTISNIGGAATTAYGIYAIYQNGIKVNNNVVTTGTGTTTTLYGIFMSTGTGSNVDINYNTVTVNGSGTTTNLVAITNNMGALAGSVNTVNMNNNTVTNCTYTTATTGPFYGIWNQANCTSLNMNNNTLSSNTTSSTSGAVYLLYNSGAVVSSININGNNINGLTFTAANSSTSLHGIYNAAGAITTNLTINNNNFQGYTFTATGTGTLNFIYNTNSCANMTVNGNTWTNLTLNYSGTFDLIYNTGSTQNALNVNNNSIVTQFTRSAAAGSMYFYYGSASALGTGTQIISGNNFSNITAATTGTGSLYFIYNADGAATYPRKTIFNNTFNNVNYNSTGTIYGIFCNYLGDGTTSTGTNIYNNTISNITTAGTMYGIYPGTSPSPTYRPNIYGNTVNNLTTTGAATIVYGAYLAGGGAGLNFYKNKIYTISATGATGYAYGIYVVSATVTSVYNNIIGDIKATTSTNIPAVNGIQVAGGTTVNLYYNSVYLTAVSSSATTFGTSGVYVSSTTPAVAMTDNVIVNNSTAGPAGGNNAALRYTSAPGTAAYTTASNYNELYCGTPSATNLIYVEGTTTPANAQQTLAAYKTYIGSGRDGFSVTENPTFLSTTGSNANYLHVSAAVATQLESHGVNISGITDDFDGDTRQGNAGYAGSGTAPDLGGDEFNGLVNDLNPPIIVYTPLGNTGLTTARTLTATVTDFNGVPTSGIGLPVLYWKVNAGSWTSQQGVSTGSNQYTFTFGSGTSSGDVVSYYVVAQDAFATPNVTSNALAGAAGFTANPPAAGTPPTTPNTYTILACLAGTYNVGAGQAYTTLTAAVNDFNSKAICGPVTFILTDATYSASETFPIVINQNIGASSVNTLTIKPNTGVTATITGAVASAPLIRILNNYTTIDGSNTAGGTTRNLMITNTSSTAPNVLLFGSTGTTPLLNCTVKNSTIINGANTSSGILVLDAPSLGNAGYFNNIVIQNNNIQLAYIGIYCYATAIAGNGSGLLITGNDMNTAGANSIRLVGVYVQGVDGATVSNNNIGNIVNANAESPKAIWFATATNSGSISGNNITNVSLTNTGAYAPSGIYVSSGATATNINIFNNTVQTLSCSGTLASFAGIISTSPNTSINNNVVSGMTQLGATVFWGIIQSGASYSTMSGNTVSGLTTATSGTATGMNVQGATIGVTISKNKIYNIKNTSSGGWNAIGLLLSSTAVNANVVASNNLVYDVAGYGYSSLTTDNGYGIEISSGGGYKLYYNTVKLSTNQTAAGYPAALFVTSGVTTPASLDIRNNIFSIDATMGTDRYAILCQAAGNVFSSLNYNDYFSSGSNFGYFGGSAYSSLATWRTALGQDANSLNVDPQFVGLTDLRVNLGSPVLGAGTYIPAVLDDYLSMTRSTTAPAMGAYEVGLDVSGPIITYTPLGNTTSTSSRTLIATITDVSGVPVTGIGLPVLYWKINAGAYSAATAVSLGGNQYQFTLGSGVAVGNVVSYYVCAQDNDSPANLASCFPVAGSAGLTINPPAAGTPPATPSSYTIMTPLCGSFNVGVGQTYATLTAAITDLNAKVLTCPVVFSLTDATYPSETFPIVINANSGSSSVNTVTIKPATGVNATISGTSASSLIKFNGAIYMFIDGSNNGTSSQNLTITNTSLSGTTAAIWVGSLGTGLGSKYITIKNCNLANGFTIATSYGIFAGASSGIGTAGDDNDNLTIQNNNINTSYYGIWAQASGSAGANDNLQITGNSIGSATPANYIGYSGINIANATGALVSQNTIYNIITSVNYTPVGMSIGSGVVNSTISRNNINNISWSGSGGYGARALYVSTGNAASNLTIANNLVYVVSGDGYTAFSNSSPVGMYFDGTTGGLNIYHNSVYMSGNTSYTSATVTTAVLFNTTTVTNIDLRNNIFQNSIVNSVTAGSKNYAIYSTAPASSFTQINNNDYFAGGSQAVLGYLGSDITTLGAWQTATAKDGASVSIDPQFVSTTDLHTLKPELNNGGAAIPAVTIDYAGTTRTTPPDIGAYEFTLPITALNTLAATAVLQTTATVNGTINSNNEVAAMSFEYGLTTGYGSTVAATPSPVRSLTSTAVSAGLTSPLCNTLYHFRVKAVSSTSAETKYGGDLTFVTLPCPTISGPISVCAGSTGNVYSTEAGNSGYVWTVSSGGIITSGAGTNSIVVTWNTAGAQTVTVNYNNSAGNPAPSATIYNVTVNARPVPVITGSASACETSCGITYTTQAGMTNYLWSVSAGGTITAGGNMSDNFVTVCWNIAGAQTVSVSYTNGGGCSATSPGIYNVLVKPLPLVTNNPVSQVICSGESTNIVLTSNMAGTSFTWSAVNITGTVWGYSNGLGNLIQQTLVNPLQTPGTVTYSIIPFANGCTGPVTVYTVTVNPVPLPPTINGSASACEGSCTEVYTTQPWMLGYNWSLSAGGVITAGAGTNAITVCWNTPGAKTVSVTYQNFYGCSGTSASPLNVTVNPMPVPTITGPDVVCTGTSTTYTTEAGMSGYTWSVSGGVITAGAGTNAITVTWSTPPGFGTVRVTYTNGNGCSAMSSFYILIGISQVPSITGPATVCGIPSAGNTYTTQVGKTGYTWTVSSGGAITSGTGTNTIVVTWSTAGTKTVTVNYSDGNGCTAATPTAYPVNVNILPVPTVTGPSPVCAGSTGNVYTTQAGMSNYTWSVSAGGVITGGGTSGSNTVTVTWNSTGTVTVNYTDANGCTGASAGSVGVTVNARPTPTISGPTPVCAGTAGNVYTTQAGMTNYAWSVSAGGTVTAGGGTGSNTVTVTWNTGGAQTVSVNYTNVNGCAAATPTVYNVTVNPRPVPVITGPAGAYLGSSGNIYSTTAGMTGYTWAVSPGNTIDAGAGTNSVSVTWNTPGSQWISVSYSDANGCTTATPTIYTVLVSALPGPAGPITGSTPVCQNQNNVAYSVAPVLNATGYVWSLPTGATIATGANTNAITVNYSAVAVSGNINVYGTNALGNGSVSPNYAVTVNPFTAPSLSGPATVCAATTGNVYTTLAGMSSYSWTVSAGGTITAGGTGTSNTVTVTWNTPGAQTVSVNYINSNGCTSATPFVYNVTVNALPVPTTTGPASVCVNSTGNVYTTQAGMTSYVWVVSAGGAVTAGGTATSNTVTVTWNTAGAQTVSIRYTNASGCIAASPVVYNVTVNPLPVPTITGPATVCAATSGNVYTTQTGMSGYLWSLSAGGTITSGAGTNSITVTWNTVGAQTVCVNYTNGNGCTAAASACYNVTVNARPAPTITGLASVCAGATGITYTTETGMTGYAWVVSAGGTVTAGGTATSNTVTVTWNTPGAQTVTVNYNNGNGCTATTATVYNVTVNPLPTPTITGNVSACVNSTGNVYTTQAGMSNYTWTVSAGGTVTAGGTATSNTVTVTWATAGVQYVRVNYNNSFGCAAATYTQYNVTVNPLPVQTITGPATACVNTNSSVYTTQAGMSLYVWTITPGGTIILGQGTNSITVAWSATGANNVCVNYANGNGCTAAAPVCYNVTVNPRPVPTMTGPATLCAGSAGNVYTTEAGMTGYTWTVSAGGTITAGGTASSNTVTVTWNTAGAQTVCVNYSNGNGCNAPSAVCYNVTVNALPVPTITGPASVCVGSTGNVYTTQAGMTGYTWTVSAGGNIMSGAATNAIIVTWTTVGAKTITVNYTNAGSCTAATPASYAVTVNALPAPAITGSAAVCQGATGVVYTTQVGMTNYVWTVSAGGLVTAGGTPTSNTVTITWTTAGANAVTVNYTNAGGCTAVTATSFPVTVSPTPMPTIGSNNTPCVGSTGNMYYTEGGMTNYTWVVSAGGAIASGQGTSAINVTWTGVGAQWVSVNYNNATSCSAIVPTVYNLFVNPLPNAAGPVTGTATLCAGTNGVAYSCADILNATSYTWTLPAGASIATGAGTKNITVNFGTNAVSGNITVAGTNSCGNGTVSQAFAVTVNPLPAAAGTITGFASVCVNATGVTYSVPAIANATSYVWALPAGVTITAGANSRNITVSFGPAAGTGVITVLGTNACGNGTVSANFNVTMNAIPSAPVVTAAGAVLTSNAATGNQWYYEGNPIAGATSQTYTVTHNTGYYWCVVTTNGCSSPVSNKVWVLVTGIGSQQVASEFIVYPNPSKGLFTISLNGVEQGTYTVEVTSNLGVTIWKMENVAISGSFKTEVDIRPAPSGVYIVLIRNNENHQVRKVLVKN